MKAGTLRGIVFTALFAALFIGLGWVKVNIGLAVPVTLQTLAVMIAGGILGARYGFISIAVVIALTATGLPLMHGAGGLGLITGATGGYIWMFPIAALLVGLVSDKVFANRSSLSVKEIAILFVGMVVFGVAVVYVAGVPWLSHVTGMPLAKAFSVGCYPFLLGDVIKAVVATAIIVAVRPRLPKL